MFEDSVFEKNSSEKMKEAFSFLELEEVDQKDFDNLLNYFNDVNEGQAVVGPDSKISARSWMLALAHLKDEEKELKEYKDILKKRYLEPVDNEVEKNKKAQEIIENGLKSFLYNSEEKNVKFPDIGTISKYSPPEKIVYPEDEQEYARTLYESGKDEDRRFVKVEYLLDKQSIKKEYAESGKKPLDRLEIEKPEESIRFTRAKSQK